MKNSGVIWTRESIFKFLKDPPAFIPGGKKGFKCLKIDQEIIDVVSYLQDLK